MTPRKELAITVVALLALSTFFFAPVVPYSTSVDSQGPGTYLVNCANLTTTGGTVTIIVTTVTLARGNSSATIRLCGPENLVAPATISGTSTLAYALLGVGQPPYQGTERVTFWNQSALVYFDGTKAVAAQWIGRAGTILNPPTLQVVRTSFVSLGLGLENYTVVMQNTGLAPVRELDLFVLTRYDSINTSVGGLTWMQPYSIGLCYRPQFTTPIGNPEQFVIPPDATCKASAKMVLPTNVDLDYYVEGFGFGESANQTYFIRQGFTQYLAAQGIDSTWVNSFISDVNGNRTHALTENATLDSFAAQRFKTASSKPEISDYGFTADASSFFTAGRPSHLTETLLFPAGSEPSDFSQYLQSSAPGHWSALVNGSYTQFGYYIGQAPYYSVSADCPTKEVTSSGVNITQYFESLGCTVSTVPDATWLVIVLGS